MRNLVLLVLIGVTAYLSTARADDAPAARENAKAVVTAQPMLTIDVKLLEISRTKMRELGVDFTTFDGQQIHKVDSERAFQQIPSTASSGFVEALVKNNLARIVADPRIAVISGEEARFSVVSQSEASERRNEKADQHLGIELQLTPTLLSGNRIQTELSLKYSWQENIKEGTEIDKQVRHFSLDTSLASASRESSILAGLVPDSSGSSFLVIVTPELAETTAAARPSVIR